jgi:hypothetical protein
MHNPKLARGLAGLIKKQEDDYELEAEETSLDLTRPATFVLMRNSVEILLPDIFQISFK